MRSEDFLIIALRDERVVGYPWSLFKVHDGEIVLYDNRTDAEMGRNQT